MKRPRRRTTTTARLERRPGTDLQSWMPQLQILVLLLQERSRYVHGTAVNVMRCCWIALGRQVPWRPPCTTPRTCPHNPHLHSQTSTAATATTAAATTQSTSHRRSTIARKAVQQAPQSVSEKLAARSKKYIQMRRVEKGGSSAAFTMGDSAGGFEASASGANAGAGDTSAAAGASDWQAAVDEASGATYYYNTVTGETQWEAPAGWSG